MGEALLLSTVNKVLIWMPEGAIVLHEGEGSYSSSTWSDSEIFVATQDRGDGGEFDKNKLLVFDKELRLVRKITLPPSVSSVHEIFWWDGKVYIASTAKDQVVAWSPEGIEIVYKAPPKQADRWSRNRTIHLNSIWCDGESFYVVEHRHGPSEVKRFDTNWNWQQTYHIGHQSHNIFVDGNLMYVNTSWYHAVAIRDLAKGQERWVKIGQRLKWKPEGHDEQYSHLAYPRGMARTRGSWYIGLSATLRRGDRDRGSSCVAVFDNGWRPVREIVIPDSGGIGTGGVRVIGETDYAHNRISCPWSKNQRKGSAA